MTNHTDTTIARYPGPLGAAFLPFTVELPAGWQRTWRPATLAVLHAPGAGPSDDAPPGLPPTVVVIEARLVPGDLALVDAARELFDAALVEYPGLWLLDERVTELSGCRAVHRTQVVPLDEPDVRLRQHVLLTLVELPGVEEQELLLVTGSCDDEDAEAFEASLTGILDSIRFAGAEVQA